jgi:hypothetical protein
MVRLPVNQYGPTVRNTNMLILAQGTWLLIMVPAFTFTTTAALEGKGGPTICVCERSCIVATGQPIG